MSRKLDRQESENRNSRRNKRPAKQSTFRRIKNWIGRLFNHDAHIQHLKRSGRYVPTPKKILLSPANWIEKRWLEPFDTWLKELSIFNILDYASKISVLIAVFTFLAGGEERTRQSHYQAWSVINTAIEQMAESGRKDALEALNKDGVSLERLNATAAELAGIVLPGANLEGATLSVADLRGANLRRANLRYINLDNAELACGSFNRKFFKFIPYKVKKCTNLRGADLRGAKLLYTDLRGADIRDADFSPLRLRKEEEFRNTKLLGTDLRDADLRGADFKDAEIGCTHFYRNINEIRCTNLGGANLSDAINLTKEQLQQAYLCKTTLPPPLKAISDRDCAEDFDTWRRRQI
jgi:uncharacterized protein YjbI with pentapeptide repeats